MLMSKAGDGVDIPCATAVAVPSNKVEYESKCMPRAAFRHNENAGIFFVVSFGETKPDHPVPYQGYPVTLQAQGVAAGLRGRHEAYTEHKLVQMIETESRIATRAACLICFPGGKKVARQLPG